MVSSPEIAETLNVYVQEIQEYMAGEDGRKPTLAKP